jgi:2-oxoisovalerate dehydrogenase E2 component (dihydrolipoyl transacylase)
MFTVTMPQLGESVTEGTILRWLKQPGEPVALDDSLCEIETEKVTAELPSPYAGTMGRQLAPEGATITVGEPLCELDPNEAAVTVDPGHRRTTGTGWSGGPMAIPPEHPTAASGTPAPPPAVAAARPAVAPPPRIPAAEAPSMRGVYSPVVTRLAAEHALDLRAIAGTGAGGRITKRDVEDAIAGGQRSSADVAPPAAQLPVQAGAPPAAPVLAAPPAAGTSVVAQTPTRRAIAEHLTKSNLEAPQAWTMVDVDVTALLALREREQARFEAAGLRLTPFVYFIGAVCEALHEVPLLNSRWEGGELRQYAQVNLGIAVATERGLVVPVLHQAGDLGPEGVARALGDLVGRARSNQLRIEDVTGGTFTVNNTGAFGSIASRPIVNTPQVGIVTFERATRRPVVLNDGIAIRAMANVCLTFDHRAMDGIDAGRFLGALKAALERVE